MKRLDLTNQRFGYLVALKPAEPYVKPNGHKISQWLCQCDCGNTTIVRTEYLRNKHTTSCGCACGRTDIIGKRFGKLTVIKKLIGSKHLCQCDCGNIIEVDTANLKNGNTQSCGCLKSKGELKINQLLTQMNYTYCTQYSFPDLIYKDTQRRAYFDFAIFNNNQLICLIEYDGIQHYVGWNENEENLKELQEKDLFKNNYCKERGIKLYRISYKDYSKITIDYLEGLIKESADAPDMEEGQELEENG